MAKFRVEVVRAKTTYDLATVEVEADNQRSARRLALTKAAGDATLQWLPDRRGPEEHGVRVHTLQRIVEPRPEPKKEGGSV